MKEVYSYFCRLPRQQFCAIVLFFSTQWNIYAQQSPTIFCTPHSTNIQADGVTPPFWASDFFEYGTSPNGFNYESIRLRIINPLGVTVIGGDSGFPTEPPAGGFKLTCDDGGPGLYLVELWGADSLGNSNYCTTHLFVDDPIHPCQSTVDSVFFTGRVINLQSATFHITGSSALIGDFSLTQESDIQGKYDLSSIPSATDIQITATNNLPFATTQGISAYDIVLIHRHIIGHTLLSSPYKMSVADVNASNHITGADITAIKNFVLGITNHLPQPNQYAIFAESYVFANPTNPFSPQNTGNPFVVNIPVLLENTTEQNFLAFKYGDVSGDALRTNDVVEDRNLPTAYIHAEDRYVRAGEVFEAQFQTAEAFTAYQFTMDLQGLEVAEILPGEGMTSNDFALLNASKTVTAVVANETARAFSIRFKATRSGNLSDMMHATNDITPSLAYDEVGKESEIAFRFGKATAPVNTIKLYPSTPNPFTEGTNIHFDLQEATKVTLRVHDAYGRTLHTQTARYTQGHQTIALTSEQLQASGVLYYSLETEKEKTIGNLIKM